MDAVLNTIVNLISNVGFPIACTIILSYVLYKVNQKWADTLDNNTEVLHKLCDKIDNIRM